MCVAASYLNGGYLHRARMQGPKAGARRSTRRFWAQHASARPPLLRAISLGAAAPAGLRSPLPAGSWAGDATHLAARVWVFSRWWDLPTRGIGASPNPCAWLAGIGPVGKRSPTARLTHAACGAEPRRQLPRLGTEQWQNLCSAHRAAELPR